MTHPPLPLLYIHGSGCTEDSFRAQSEAFSGSDPVSLPGHPSGEALESVEAHAAWFARYVQWKHAGRAVVAGNSLGGAITLRWALEFPDQAAGLILIGTGARLRVSPQIFEMIDQRWPDCIDVLSGMALAPDAPAALRDRFRQWHLGVGRLTTRLDYAACDRFDAMGDLGRIKIPTLIIAGSLDKMTPPKFSQYLHEQIAGSTLTIIEGAGHLVMAERPAQVNAAIAQFLEQVREKALRNPGATQR
jgi:pimeloyl-ACP methyl ester carboxylesterase